MAKWLLIGDKVKCVEKQAIEHLLHFIAKISGCSMMSIMLADGLLNGWQAYWLDGVTGASLTVSPLHAEVEPFEKMLLASLLLSELLVSGLKAVHLLVASL